MKPEKHATVSLPRFTQRDEKLTKLQDHAIHRHPSHNQQLHARQHHQYGQKSQQKQRIIHPSELKSTDILCGRSSTAFNNVGNRRFRATITANIQRYLRAPSRQEKGIVIHSVVNHIQNEIGARFLKRVKYGYVELTERKQREKVGHALRDLAVQMEEAKVATMKAPEQVKSSSPSTHPRPRPEASKNVESDTPQPSQRPAQPQERARYSSVSQRASRSEHTGKTSRRDNFAPEEPESSNFGHLLSYLMDSIENSDDDESLEPLPLF